MERELKPFRKRGESFTHGRELPKLYHIVHVDRLRSILADGQLNCDASMLARQGTGTTIGLSRIKQRRLTLPLSSHQGLRVGECVPFYFCPRSVMLFLIHRANDPDLAYRGGQGPIIHLEMDLHAVVNWADANAKRWAFTLSNAGAYYFEDRSDLTQLNEINWAAVRARQWAGAGISSTVKEGKQAEFLVETCVPWHLVEQIGVHSAATGQRTVNTMAGAAHRPPVAVQADWYY